jgi:hypothetical protein
MLATPGGLVVLKTKTSNSFVGTYLTLIMQTTIKCILNIQKEYFVFLPNAVSRKAIPVAAKTLTDERNGQAMFRGQFVDYHFIIPVFLYRLSVFCCTFVHCFF